MGSIELKRLKLHLEPKRTTSLLTGAKFIYTQLCHLWNDLVVICQLVVDGYSIILTRMLQVLPNLISLFGHN